MKHASWKKIYVIVINNKILVSWESAKILNDAVYSLSWQVFNALFIVYTTLKKNCLLQTFNSSTFTRRNWSCIGVDLDSFFNFECYVYPFILIKVYAKFWGPLIVEGFRQISVASLEVLRRRNVKGAIFL